MSKAGWSVVDRAAMPGNEGRKRWQGRAWDPRLRRYQKRSFDSAGEARAWAKKRAAEFLLGQGGAGRVPLGVAVEAYWDFMRRKTHAGTGRKLSEKHLDMVKRDLERVLDVVGGDISDPNLLARVEAAIAGLKARRRRDGRELGPKGKREVAATWRAFGRWVAARPEFAVRENPFAELRFSAPKTDFRDVYALEDLRRMVSDEARGEAWWLFVVLACYTGMRSAEIALLRWEWIAWEQELIILPGAQLKSGRSRLVPLQAELAAILRETGAGARVGEIFTPPRPWPSWRAQFAAQEVRAYLEQLGVAPPGDGSRPRVIHDIRHSVASLLTATGLGHFLVMDYIGDSTASVAKHYATSAMMYRHAVREWRPGEIRLRGKG